MRNLIYQYFDGPDLPGTAASVRSMKEYAERIGAEHLFEKNPNWVISQGKNYGKYNPHFGCLKIIYDDYFNQYDNVLFLDQDIMAVDNLQENIFDIEVGHMGICEEEAQPAMRKELNDPRHGGINNTNDERWCKAIWLNYQAKMPRTDDGLPKVYNSGVMLWSRAGREYARKYFRPVEEYGRMCSSLKLPAFYFGDQNYIHAMLEAVRVDWTVMDSTWNSCVHYVPGTSGNNRPVSDHRTPDTKFVHVQLRAADHFDYDKMHRIANLPVSEWNL